MTEKEFISQFLKYCFCQHCGSGPENASQAENLFLLFGKLLPFHDHIYRITSIYRCQEWDKKLTPNGKNRTHTRGLAVDMFCHEFILSDLKKAGAWIKDDYSDGHVHVDFFKR